MSDKVKRVKVKVVHDCIPNNDDEYVARLVGIVTDRGLSYLMEDPKSVKAMFTSESISLDTLLTQATEDNGKIFLKSGRLVFAVITKNGVSVEKKLLVLPRLNSIFSTQSDFMGFSTHVDRSVTIQEVK